MLKLVFGRSGYGKTEYVFNNIKALAENGCENIILITPEQYSLIAERRLLTDLGEAGIRFVENSSFSRICDEVKRKYGWDNLPLLSKGGKAIMMMRAIDMSKDSLVLFNKKIDSLSFVNSMIKIYDEMKSCNLNSDEISSMSQGIENDVLYRKLCDISSIMNSYEKIIDGKFLDTSDELTRLYNKIKDIGYFKNKNIFIDGFNGFVAQEYKILELIIKEAEAVTITLCTDSFEESDRFNLFSYVNDSAKIINKIAKKSDVKVEFEYLTENHRAENNELSEIEKNIFSNTDSHLSENQNVKIYSSKNISDECAEASRQIKKLLKDGYHTKDIAVITRDIDKYRDELSYNFKKYEIPFFYDERQPVKSQPIIVFVEYLLRCINYSYRSDDILSLAKTGLTAVTDEQISELENYIYLWNINGLKWTKDFENPTKAFGSAISDRDIEKLKGINNTRKMLIEPLQIFKSAVKNANVTDICAQIYYALLNFGADTKLKETAVKLNELNCPVLALEQGRIWDMLMEILNQISSTIGGDFIPLKDVAKLFSLIISTEDLGSIPQGLDNVQFGQADRIRTDNPKAVFILGANEGEFPQAVSGGGLLSENDRRILLDNDFKLYSYGEILNLQERYFAYMACSAASKKLYVFYLGNTGKEASPSEIVTSIKKILPNVKEYSFNDIDDIDLIESYSSAFELMSERYHYNNPFYSSLKKFFENDKRYLSVRQLAENNDYYIYNKEAATKLFDYNMYVSASRIEDYYNCPFRYFCKFGLAARPREKAEINPMQRGTIIHYVLEMIFKSCRSYELSKMSESDMKKLVDFYIDEYFKTKMGGIVDLSLRFKYNYKRLSKLIYGVVFRLAKEFSESDFEAKGFEVKIDRDGTVKPEVINLDDGGTIQIRGSIDRVDTYEKNSQRYVRVVDYKSGNKEFNLNDIINGLNLQMFIYLFSLCEDSNNDFNGIPAGVLYMHSSRKVFSFDSQRDAGSKIEKKENDTFRMKGIVLDDTDGEIPQAMEHDLGGRYIPVKMKKNGELTGSLATLEELGRIHKKINSLIAQMGMELHNGFITQRPVKNSHHKHTCVFCDYSDICANKRHIDEKITEDLSDSEVKSALVKEFEENAELDTSTE
ncbi:MAG: PD-(D/E)XK nuclease family protein [Eubacterium sp.]